MDGLQPFLDHTQKPQAEELFWLEYSSIAFALAVDGTLHLLGPFEWTSHRFVSCAWGTVSVMFSASILSNAEPQLGFTEL